MIVDVERSFGTLDQLLDLGTVQPEWIHVVPEHQLEVITRLLLVAKRALDMQLHVRLHAHVDDGLLTGVTALPQRGQGFFETLAQSSPESTRLWSPRGTSRPARA